MITITCLILWMPELPLDVWEVSAAPAPAPAPTVSAARATTPARLLTRVGITSAILPTPGVWIIKPVSELREVSQIRRTTSRIPELADGVEFGESLLRHPPTTNFDPFTDRRVQGAGFAAAGGAVAAGTLSTVGASSLAFAAAPEAPTPKTPDEALARLLAGNKRFVQGKTTSPRRDSVRRTEVAQGQKPFAIILTCSDSRLAPEVV